MDPHHPVCHTAACPPWQQVGRENMQRGQLTLPRLKHVGFLVRWGVPPSVVLQPFRRRLRWPCAPRPPIQR